MKYYRVLLTHSISMCIELDIHMHACMFATFYLYTKKLLIYFIYDKNK